LFFFNRRQQTRKEQWRHGLILVEQIVKKPLQTGAHIADTPEGISRLYGIGVGEEAYALKMQDLKVRSTD